MRRVVVVAGIMFSAGTIAMKKRGISAKITLTCAKSGVHRSASFATARLRDGGIF